MVSRQGHEQLAGSSFRPVKISLFKARGERLFAEQQDTYWETSCVRPSHAAYPQEKPGVSEGFDFLFVLLCSKLFGWLRSHTQLADLVGGTWGIDYHGHMNMQVRLLHCPISQHREECDVSQSPSQSITRSHPCLCIAFGERWPAASGPAQACSSTKTLGRESKIVLHQQAPARWCDAAAPAMQVLQLRYMCFASVCQLFFFLSNRLSLTLRGI